MTPHRRLAAVCLSLAAVTTGAACGTSSPSSGSNASAPIPRAQWLKEVGPFGSVAKDPQGSTAAGGAEHNGTSAQQGSGTVSPDEPIDPNATVAPETSAGTPPFDPCSLVTTDEVRSSFGSVQGPFTLEYGDACGYADRADTQRVAVGWFPVSGDPAGGRWLTSRQRSAATSVDGFDAPAYWAPGVPLAEGATLVLERPTGDLVIEIYGRSAHIRSGQRTTAVTFMRAASGRTPS